VGFAPSEPEETEVAEPQKAVVTARPKTIETMPLRAVYGLLIHPYTQARFDSDKVVDHVVDDWVKTQMDGGKLKFAE
jgi:hypothetical protein